MARCTSGPPLDEIRLGKVYDNFFFALDARPKSDLMQQAKQGAGSKPLFVGRQWAPMERGYRRPSTSCRWMVTLADVSRANAIAVFNLDQQKRHGLRPT